MRTKQEISQAAAILRQKGDRLSLEQAVIAENRCTEAWVFEHYVTNVSPQNKDETLFFAARDAARYVAGGISLEALIPDASEYPALEETDASTGATLLISADILERLIRQIARLEQKVDALTAHRTKNIAYTTLADCSKDDFLTQKEACEYIGCSKVTLLAWMKKGLVKGSRRGSHIYYSQSELDENITVQNFKNLKPTQP